jgi:serine/threonine protein kinase
MSPEQLMGKPQDQKSDVYGLGIILYEMIYGRIPYSGNNTFGIIQNIVNSPVLCPDFPDVPKQVKRFIEQCLNKNIEKRPTQVVEILKQLLVTDNLTMSAPSSYRNPIILWSVGVFGISALLMVLYRFNIQQHFFNLLNVLSITNTEVLLGVLFIIVGIITGILVKKWFVWNSKKLQDDLNIISQGNGEIEKLSLSMAIDLKELLTQCKNADERILGKTVAIMFDEYKNAESFDDRKDALLAAVEFLDKLNKRLSPWYVKYEKFIVIVVSLVGIVSGVIKIIKNVN